MQDDYVKFIRFAQWKIDEAGEGVLGFITNHSYLDNPTFRGMRQSLMKSFDEIYITRSSRKQSKKRKSSRRKQRQNVFDIQQGVAIAFFIKYKKSKTEKTVYHQENFGLRKDKYDWLDKHNIKNVKWNRIDPKSEFYLFVPQDARLYEAYNKYEKVTDIFPVDSVGIVTARDALTIGWSKEGNLESDS